MLSTGRQTPCGQYRGSIYQQNATMTSKHGLMKKTFRRPIHGVLPAIAGPFSGFFSSHLTSDETYLPRPVVTHSACSSTLRECGGDTTQPRASTQVLLKQASMPSVFPPISPLTSIILLSHKQAIRYPRATLQACPSCRINRSVQFRTEREPSLYKQPPC